jgi:hypothetical protein
MHRYSIQPLVALILAANLSLGMAAAPAVGVVTARGSFTIDDSRIAGNATLFEGSRIVTGTAPSQLQLNNGASMQLAAESSGIVYRDRLVLESGSGRFDNHGVEALSLRIRPEGAAEVSVRNSGLDGAGLVEVAALNGPVRVTTANGVLLANLQTGRKLAFQPAAAAPDAPTTLTGCLESAGGKFLLTDESSLVRFEVAGSGVAREAGHRIQISGAITPVPEAMSQMQATGVRQLSKKCSNRATAAAAAGVGAPGSGSGSGSAGTGAAGAGSAGSGAAGASTAGVLTGTSHLIIAGVVVAAAATGTAVAVVKANDSPAPISPSGR